MRVKYILHKFKVCLYSFLDALGEGIFKIINFSRLLPSPRFLSQKNIRNILVIRIDRIGDMVLSTPSFRALKETFPDANITLLLKEYTHPLVLNNKSIDNIIVMDKLTFGALIARVRRLKPDIVIALNYSPLSNLISFLSGALQRVGFESPGAAFFLTKKAENDLKLLDAHKVDLYLNMVKYIGAKTDKKELEVSITPSGERTAEKFYQENHINTNNGIVIIHPGSRQSYIRWKKEGFAQLADRIIKEFNMLVILLGSAGEKALVEEVASLMKEKPVLAIEQSLTTAVSLINRANIFIGNSTGTIHIAAALKVPVVAIFGSIHPMDHYKKWGPWGKGHIVVSKDLNCRDCHPSNCKTYDCMKLISVDDVFEAVEKQLGKNK